MFIKASDRQLKSVQGKLKIKIIHSITIYNIIILIYIIIYNNIVIWYILLFITS